MIDYDLHIHSTFSDGTLTPKELFASAAASGLKGLSITDHDTLDAMCTCEKLAATTEHAIDFVPGIELSTEHLNQEIHILGYYIDYTNPELLAKLDGFKRERFNRVLKMIDRLNELGFHIALEDVILASGGEKNSLGRPHIARALISKGYFTNINEVFEKLLANGKPGYVDRFKISTIDGIKLIRNYNGIPVLAHPGLLKASYHKLDSLVSEFVAAGLLGIEVFHSDHTMETSLLLTKLVNKYELLTTGGSDYHSPNTSRDIRLGSRGVTSYHIDRLKKLHETL